jgi:hypothetical protein
MLGLFSIDAVRVGTGVQNRAALGLAVLGPVAMIGDPTLGNDKDARPP